MVSFRYPEYLWGLLLLLVPILIHLLRFRRQQIKHFPGVFRLIALLKETQSTRNLKHYLLLLNRLLLLFALVMVFAQPTCNNKIGTNSNLNLGIIWDASPSMWAPAENGEIPIEVAKIATLKWLKSLPESAFVFWLDKPYQAKTRYTKSEAIAKLTGYTQPLGYFPLSRLISDNRISEKNINWFVISDEDNHAHQDFASWIDSSATFNFVDLNLQHAVNFSIDTAYCFDALEGRIKARISRSISQGKDSILMEVSSNNSFIGDFNVSFNENEQSKWVELMINELSNSSNRIKLKIPADSYNYDNELYLTPASNQKAKVFLKSKEQPEDLNRLIKAFEDRLVYTDSIVNSDVIIWMLEDSDNDQNEVILNRIKSGYSCIIIPVSKGSQKMKEFLTGGEWKPFKEGAVGEIIDYRGFAQEPFKSSLERYLDGKNVLPKVNDLFTFPYDKNLEWNRILITDSERDFLVKRSWGDGEIWMFLSDYNQGMKTIRESSWFVGILGPILLSNNATANSICAFWDEEWIEVPNSDLFKVQDPVILKNQEKEWGTSLGINKGALSFTGVKDEFLKSDWYQLYDKIDGDSVNIGINAPRVELRFTGEKVNLFNKENIQKIQSSKWQVSRDFTEGVGEYVSIWKYLILVFMLLELFLGVLVLRTNR